MKKFMDENFMLQNETAIRLFHDFAKDMPIYDYHCHLSPQMIYEDLPFENITQIFLGGDHYKWRYMRSCGIEEKYITGDASDREKFQAFCGALQYGIGNPLYHWTHLELQRYFGIDEIVREDTADIIWEKANAYIKETQMSPVKLINSSNVALVCTTDDPVDDLSWHKKIAEKGNVKAKVLPAFRPDRVTNIEKPDFIQYIQELSKAAEITIQGFQDLLDALQKRIEYFHSVGCRISDHGMDYVPYAEASFDKIDEIFRRRISGNSISKEETDAFKTAVLIALGKSYHKYGWTFQIHTGAMRNNNSKMFAHLGADTGFDSISDYPVALPLSRLLDSLAVSETLPKTILYTLNPKDNYVLGTMLGNFQGSEVPGKIQFGSGWWFNDQRDGMMEQMKALANLGALHTFVGMLTDSRSFLSYPRHEYFRRIMCNFLGTCVENGEFPADMDTLETIVKGISFNNAKRYFGIEL